MKKFTLLFSWLLGVSLLVSIATRADELPWQDDYAKALAEATEKHQPVLLDFSASWCGPCRMMETTTFADPGVREELKGYLLVKIDLDQARDLAARYHVEAIPTCIVLNQFGEKVDGRTGYLDAAHFAAWIHQYESVAFARESQAAEVAKFVKTAVGQLESPREADRTVGLAYLLDKYCGPLAREDGEAKLAANELRAWFGRHPARAVPLLNEPRLAVRIFVSVLFAEKLGATFQFDPWDNAGNRAAAAGRVAEQLGKSAR